MKSPGCGCALPGLRHSVGDVNIVPVTGAGLSPEQLWVRGLHGVGSDVGVETHRSESRGGGSTIGGEVGGSVFGDPSAMHRDRNGPQTVAA